MEGPIKLQAAASHRLQGGAGVLAEETGRDRPDRVVHRFEKEHVRIAGVARKEERRILTAPIDELPVAAGPASEDDVDAARVVALVDDVLARGDHAALSHRPG
ncbi:MAG: hypothetical protein NTV85_33410 [Hyphomicrobiales bacterium]|nr:MULTISPECIES: hypothetical protein [unclassified Methylobacterium]MCX7336426.1 hypothetical protein [Hyphomicrobiales bacterium]